MLMLVHWLLFSVLILFLEQSIQCAIDGPFWKYFPLLTFHFSLQCPLPFNIYFQTYVWLFLFFFPELEGNVRRKIEKLDWEHVVFINKNIWKSYEKKRVPFFTPALRPQRVFSAASSDWRFISGIHRFFSAYFFKVSTELKLSFDMCWTERFTIAYFVKFFEVTLWQRKDF